jgi:predicted transcriptional regulator of viral defense system
MDSTRAWVDRMHASGRLVFTAEQARVDLDATTTAAWSALSRAQAQGLLYSPAQGLYVVVPAEYRTAGAPPWQWYLDPMMQHLKVGYYAGLLTAAAYHGTSPQAAQEIQVVVDRQVLNRPAGRGRLRFVQNPRAGHAPATEVPTPTGRVRISTPEVTMLDLVAHPGVSGGWSNVASLLADLGRLGSKRGWQQALRTGPAVLRVQRLGYLLDRTSAPHTDELSGWLASRSYKAITLVPGGRRDGVPDPRWRVIPDPLVQPD